ncbi:MAG: DUF5050 domain-containing protein [Bacillota bacterium]|nr:DUF5050 domain-containing protein [Bacillota bacterium]
MGQIVNIRKKFFALIAIAAVTCILITGCSKGSIKTMGDGTANENGGSTSANLNRNSDIFVDDGWIYFSKPAGNDIGISGYCLYKAKLEGTDVTKLAELGAQHISKQGDRLYFTDMLSHKPYSIKKDGTGLKKLFNYELHSMTTDSNHIYYALPGDSVLYSCSLDGSGQKTLIKDMTLHEFGLHDGWIYYSGENHMMHKVKIDGTGDVNLNIESGGDVHKVYTFDENYVFQVIDLADVVKTTLDGGNQVKAKFKAKDVFTVDSTIYYIDYDEANKQHKNDGQGDVNLYKVGLGLTGPIVVTKDLYNRDDEYYLFDNILYSCTGDGDKEILKVCDLKTGKVSIVNFKVSGE